MSQATQDSSLSLLYGSWPETAPEPDVPVLDLDSTEPLPFDLDALAKPMPVPISPDLAAAPAPAAPAAEGGEEIFTSDDGSIWLRGDVLMCACPDCGAPMSIRLWLMLADCWRCATTIELNEEQEREVERLLKKRDQARKEATRRQAVPKPKEKAAAPAPAPIPKPVEKKPLPPPPPEKKPPPPPEVKTPPPPPTPKPRTVEQPQQQRRVAAAKKPIGVRAKYHKMAVLGGTRLVVSDFFKNMPAWVISALFHLIVVTILGLLYYDDEPEEPFIVLSSDVAAPRSEGGDVNAIVDKDPQYDLPVMKKPENEQQRRALQIADQDARELRLDPDAPLPHLPELNQIKEMIGSSDIPRRMVAARDPRVRVEMVKQEGGTTMTEAAVSRGLRWIAKDINADGGWGLRANHSDAAGTSLALLPFLGAGQTHQTGMYRPEVSKGLRWLIERQKQDGDLRSGTTGNHGMYAHGQAAIVLCEAYAMTGDEQLRRPAQMAIDFIVNAQHAAGGWRYSPGQPGDTSVVGWQLMALQSARAAKLTVPDTTLDLAGQFLDSVQHDDGAKYAYQRGRQPTETMTAEGLLCRLYLGWNKQDNPQLGDGVDWLINDHLPSARNTNMYYWYYATQVMHHYGGPEWEKWNQEMRDVLIQTQVSSGENAGSWDTGGPHGSAGGRLYMTSLATCSLEVYYRHAPIFRQLKLE